jgi:hypothetical protein
MKFLRSLVLVPAWFLFVAAGSQGPSPTPTPQPNANIVLDTAAGGPNTKITVNGTMFLAHEDVTLYWDSPNKVAAKVTSDRNGAFTTTVTPYPGDRVELHNLCASVGPPTPCANFTLQGPPSPTPAESPSPSSSSSPSGSAAPSTSPSPISLTGNSDGSTPLDVITRPPLVFLPIIGLLGLLAALAYWVLMKVDRDRPPVLPSATVIHRSARPDLAPMHSRTPLPGDQPPPPPAEPPPAPPSTPEQPPY